VQLKMRNSEKEQKGILLMTGISMAGRDLQINYVVGLALFFDSSNLSARPIPPLRRTGDGVKCVHPLARAGSSPLKQTAQKN
jgi:hypothetical protein